METKVMKVYYNEQGLPFKDSALTIPYSIIGSEFTGANNTTEIRFYVENIDNELTWVANIKLQDGTLTYRHLTPIIDEDNKTYQLLEMDNGITSKKGFIYLGLNGYGGETLIEEVNGVLTINGNPTIVATGTISIALNYTPIVIPLGTSVEPTEIQQILSALSIKQDKFNLNNVRGYDTLALATTDLPNLIEGQIIIVKGTPTEIYQVQSGALVDLIVNKATSDSLGNVIKDSYVSAVYPTYNTTTDKLFIETYSVEDVLMANNEVILPKATTTKNGLMAKEDKVKVDGLATTYETIVNSDAKIKNLGSFNSVDAFIKACPENNILFYGTINISGGTYKCLGMRNFGTPMMAVVIRHNGVIEQYNFNAQNENWVSVNTHATQYWVTTQLATKQSTSEKGQPNGYASLDGTGKVPTAQLPSYVDDVLEFANLASFPATGSASVIYVALDTNLTYRWSGSAYVEISPSLALGETAETAYRGDRGKIAYDHSQITDGSNPHETTFANIASKPTTISGYGITDAVNSIISITYANLKTLRDSSQLIKGQQYRITDFVTTTAQTNTQSAGHAFDLIVVADDVNKLNENARACLHSGDTYFANSKLEAWQVWYSLDNDTNRFAWADTVNGKGVIYHMIDEWNNDCPYDFKNIKFLRDTNYYYTFCVYDDVDTEDIVDVSTIQNRFKNDENGYSAVFNNKINEWKDGPFDDIEDSYSYKSAKLNDIVFINKISYDVFYGIRGNTFGTNCYSNTFGDSCYYNTFGTNCYYNTFGNGCFSNTFGSDCFSNTFGSDCQSNTFGNYCYSNTFGNSCYYNNFGNDCVYNNFGNGCFSNTFGSDCYSNTFGNDCVYNNFGNGCFSNTFGSDCYSNTFGNGCFYNKLVSNGTYKNNAQHIIFENGVSYIDLQASDATGILKNIHISMGVVGASTQNMKVITEPRDLTHDVIYRATGSEDKVA